MYIVHLFFGVYFHQVIQWCTHHKDDPPPPEDDENKEKRTDDIPVWDQEFLKVDQGTLFELILVNTSNKLINMLFFCNGIQRVKWTRKNCNVSNSLGLTVSLNVHIGFLNPLFYVLWLQMKRVAPMCCV